MKPKRNETCHCGSGKKYKVCHGTTKEATNNVVYFIAGLAIAVFIFLFFGSSDSGSESLPVSHSPILPYTSRSSPKPPGDAPPGKVWSEEHGHWHDAPQQISGPVETRPRRIETPPKLDKNNPPPGKVWSEEHGHWHDDPRKSSNNIKINPNQDRTSKKTN